MISIITFMRLVLKLPRPRRLHDPVERLTLHRRHVEVGLFECPFFVSEYLPSMIF